MKNIKIKITKNNEVCKIEEEKIKWLVGMISEKYSLTALKIAIKNIKKNNSKI